MTKDNSLLLRMNIWRVFRAVGYRRRSGDLKTTFRLRLYMKTDPPFKRVLTSFGFRPPTVTSVQPVILPPDIPIEEELAPGYDHRHFYPVNPGDIFHNRYEMTAKLGYGSCSTVWLARDTQRYALSPCDAFLLIFLQAKMAVQSIRRREGQQLRLRRQERGGT